jgi:ubiquinone/menaquinone biosynthesis C-methylase UbiE
MTAIERDYVLGTHDEEVMRLALQHRVWRRRALDAWIDAGFTAGQTLVDVGAGPGHATIDLAEIAGANGRVVAIDRSARFLDFLKRTAADRALGNILTFEADLDEDRLPLVTADGAWARWVFAFVKQPKELLRKVRDVLKPGAPLVIHEYFDYRSWRLSPRSEVFEDFVGAVMKTWRGAGGEPDIALDLLRWLPEAGFQLQRQRTMVDVITPSNFIWQWPVSFVNVGVDRLVSIGEFPARRAAELKRVVAEAKLMTTPAVLQITATAV